MATNANIETLIDNLIKSLEQEAAPGTLRALVAAEMDLIGRLGKIGNIDIDMARDLGLMTVSNLTDLGRRLLARLRTMANWSVRIDSAIAEFRAYTERA